MASAQLKFSAVNRSIGVSLSLFAFAMSTLWPASARAQYTKNVLYDFNFLYSPGLTADAQGNLYGAVTGGGAYGEDAIFEMSPPANGSLWWTQRILYAFPANAFLSAPGTALTFDSQGNLYGSSPGQGGVAGCGGVFKISPPVSGSGSWSETDIYDFAGNHGCGSSSLVIDSQGNLYGASEIGGATKNGVIYELSPPSSGTGAWNETVLYSFTGGSDGFYPLANLTIDSRGNLYGTTSYGGSASGCSGYGCGTVFELSPPNGSGTWTETTLYTFAGGGDGGQPFGLTLDPNNNLYGSTTVGGDTSVCPPINGSAPGCGGIFELSPPSGSGGAWTLTVLHNFSGNDGQGPATGLVIDAAGELFGATANGGLPACPNGCGVVFSLVPPSGRNGPWTENVLYAFSGKNDGESPFFASTVLMDAKKNIYGTLSFSDATNCSQCGSIYQLSPTLLVPTSTAVIPSVNSATLGESVTFTATVTPSGPPVPTGTVGFASNGIAIEGCSSLPLSAGQALCSTSALPAGSNSVVAVYSGDGTYSESAGAQPENVIEPQLALSVTPAAVSVKAGGSVTTSLNLTVAQGAPSGATTFACTGLPSGASCSFAPSQVTAFPASVTVTISTVPGNASLRSGLFRLSVAFALALPALLLVSDNRKSGKRSLRWPLVAPILIVMFSLGCGGSSGSGSGGTGGSTNYTVLVTATATGAASASATIDLTVLH